MTEQHTHIYSDSQKVAWQLDTTSSVINWIDSLGWEAILDANGKVASWGKKPHALIEKEEGFNIIRQFIQTTLNKEISSSTVSEDTIRKETLARIQRLIITLYSNMQEYGIKSYSACSEIINGARTMALFHLSKSTAGFMVRQLNEQRQIRIDESPKEQKKGIWNRSKEENDT